MAHRQTKKLGQHSAQHNEKIKMSFQEAVSDSVWLFCSCQSPQRPLTAHISFLAPTSCLVFTLLPTLWERHLPALVSVTISVTRLSHVHVSGVSSSVSVTLIRNEQLLSKDPSGDVSLPW